LCRVNALLRPAAKVSVAGPLAHLVRANHQTASRARPHSTGHVGAVHAVEQLACGFALTPVDVDVIA
jgi:hypothetical protein